MIVLPNTHCMYLMYSSVLASVVAAAFERAWAAAAAANGAMLRLSGDGAKGDRGADAVLVMRLWCAPVVMEWYSWCWPTRSPVQRASILVYIRKLACA